MNSLDPTASREARLEAVLGDYLRAREAGAVPDRAEWIARHPDLASDLADFLDDQALFEGVASPLVSPAPDSESTPRAAPDGPTATFLGAAPTREPAAPVAVPDYELRGELARGGMGVVYRCHDPALDRELAVKVLRSALLAQPDVVRRFFVEARIAGRLQHPGVVPVHRVGRTADGRPYFTMKLVRGATLADLLRQRPNPAHDLPRFLKVFEQVAQAVAYAHDQGVIHRDLKPLNVMVGAFAEVQVMDWGLAKETRNAELEVRNDAGSSIPHSELRVPSSSDVTRDGAIIGTPSYIPPEQARGELDRVDERADVFGLGAILCEILTGRPPFDGADQVDVLLRARAGDLAAARERLDRCGADDDLRALAARCLAPDPADRPRMAGVVAEAMSAHLASVQDRLRAAEVERAAAQARAEEAVRARRLADQRRRLGVALAVSVMGLVTLGVGGWFWIDRDRAVRAAAAAQALNDRTGRTEAELERALALRDEARAAGEDAGKWAEALAAARRAEGVATGDDLEAGLRQRVADLVAELVAEKRDRDLIDRLREARLQGAEVAGDKFDTRAVAPAYAAAFRGAGVDDGMPPDDVAAALGRRSVSEHLAVALFDWATVHPDRAARDRLRAAADRVDPDAGRVALRAALAARDMDGLKKRAADLNVRVSPPQTIRLLADALARGSGPDGKGPPGDLAGAITLLRKGQAQYPREFWLNHQLAFYLMRAQPPQYDEAIRFYTAAVSVHPRSPGAYLNLASALSGRARHDEVIAALTEAIRLKPDYAMAHGSLAAALLAKDRKAEALAAAQEAVRLNPTAVYTRTALGRALQANGRLPEAIAEFQAVTRLDRANVGAWWYLARAQDHAGRPDEAIAAIQEAIKLDNGVVNHHTFLAGVLRKQGRVDDALAVLHRAQQMWPQQAMIQTALNEAWQDKSRQSQSIPDLRQAVARNPKDADALVKLAKLETAAWDAKNALTHFGMAVAAQPQDPLVLAEAGRGNLTLGNHRAAADYLQRALRLSKEPNPAVELDYGRALMETGRLELAVQTFTKVTAARPNDPWAYHYLSLTHERRGDYPAALAAHKLAAERRRNSLNFVARPPDHVTELARKAALTEKGEAVLRGQAKLDPADRGPFAHICFVQKKYVSAARFFAEAFADKPALADDRQAGHRLTGAAAAVRAGLGLGPEGQALLEGDRVRHRRRAYDWLAGELAALEKQMAKAPEAEFFAIQDYLRGWGGDVFDDREFDFGALPAGEREQWQRLWERADELASRAKTPN